MSDVFTWVVLAYCTWSLSTQFPKDWTFDNTTLNLGRISFRNLVLSDFLLLITLPIDTIEGNFQGAIWMTRSMETADCWCRTLSRRKEKTKHSLGQKFRRVGLVKASVCQSSVHLHTLQHPVIIVSSCHYVFISKEWDSALILSAHSLPI